MARELCCRSKTLGAIFRCSAELGRTNDLRLFTSRLLTELMSIASADFFFLRLFSESERHLNVFATSENSATLPPLNPGEGALSVEMEAAFTKKCIEFGPGRPLESGDALLAPLGSEASGLARPLVADDTLLGVLTVGRRLEAPPFSPEQAEAIHLFADFLGIQIVNARLREQHVTSRLLSHELELAAQIQRSLLPRTLPHPRGYGLAAHCESARQLGGDFCDVLQISENLLLLLVADVMGKGVPAALFASILHNLIRVMPEWLDRPADMLARVNSMLYERLSAVDMFITVQLALVDLKEKKITVATAGQGPVLLASKGLRTCEILCPEGMPLGVVGDPEFCNQTSTLGPNARVLLYTDGLTEARNAQGELFGLARLQAWLQASTRLSCSAEELKEFLLETLTHFGVESPLRDDQTFIILAEEMETS
ncbi:MAG TPA: GAF domain-containing SpoIIE family protein phosphatase [Verrucomicrobiae bacterium]|jgi:serine phosphatase RsbU (regulator of sigma subunit)